MNNMIREGEIIGGTYQLIRQIGKGGSGLVFLAYHRNLRKYVVLKRVPMRFGDMETLRAETDILKNLHHSYIPQVYDFVVRDGEVFTVMDFIEGTSFDKLPAGNRQIPERQLQSMLIQLAEVLAYLHKNRPPVIHSDIKPDNLILRQDGHICLIDFNISVSDSVGSSLSGYSMHFASPEQCRMFAEMRNGRKPSVKLDARTDIYSTGALFYYLITGRYCDTRQVPSAGNAGGWIPSEKGARSGQGVYYDANILYRDMLSCGYSEILCRVIARCLEQDRNRRYKNGAKLLAAFRHLKLQDRRFLGYIALRAASWIVAASLIGGGSYYLIRGTHQKVQEDYVSQWEHFERMVRVGDEKGASEAGTSILNDSRFAQIRADNPGNTADITRTLGDYAYYAGQYELAASNYEEALNYAREAGEETSRYYRDYAISLVLSGKVHRAENVLEEASRNGIEDSDSLLVQAYIQLNKQDKDEDACIETVEKILQTSTDNDLCARACVLAAEASSQKREEEKDRMYWLRLAGQYSGDARYQRMLASACMEQGEDSRSANDQREKSIREALSIYEKLADAPGAMLIDKLNRVNTMLYLAKFEQIQKDTDEMRSLCNESLRILRSLEKSEGENPRIYLLMATAYDILNDDSNASYYARMALQLYESLPSSEKTSEDQEAIRYLEEIR